MCRAVRGYPAYKKIQEVYECQALDHLALDAVPTWTTNIALRSTAPVLAKQKSHRKEKNPQPQKREKPMEDIIDQIFLVILYLVGFVLALAFMIAVYLTPFAILASAIKYLGY